MSVSVDSVIEVIEETLVSSNQGKPLSENVTAESRMNFPKEWDSLAFVNVFMAVQEAFNLDVDEDEAINFMSVRGIVDFINQ